MTLSSWGQHSARRRSAGSDRVSGVEGGGASGSGASIATSLPAAVVAHLVRLSGPSLRRSTPCEVAGGRTSAAVAPPALTEYRAFMRRRRKAGLVRHGHHACHRPCRRPCHPLPPCLRRGRRWERPAGLACCPCWGRARGTHVTCLNGLQNQTKNSQGLSQPLRPPGTRGRRRGALGGPF